MAAADKFDRFTEEARRVLMYAQEEAAQADQTYIGTEHILVGLTRAQDGLACRVLGYSGVTVDWVRSTIELVRGRSIESLNATGVSAPVMRTIDRAVDEAQRLNHTYVGTGHLLLPLTYEAQGVLGTVLLSLGVDLDQLRSRLTVALSQSNEQTDTA